MFYLLASWLLSAFALWLTGQLVPRFEVRGFDSALLGAAVIAIVNYTLANILNFIMLPITILTLGLFIIVINALLLKLASAFSPGFRIQGFLPAIIGSLVLAIFTGILRFIMF
jgi:putative membrane protein